MKLLGDHDDRLFSLGSNDFMGGMSFGDNPLDFGLDLLQLEGRCGLLLSGSDPFSFESSSGGMLGENEG